MTRREIKILVKQFDELWEDRETTLMYWNAIRAQDVETLQFFASMGEDVRHRIMNAHEYIEGKRFGFTEIAFDDCGWLDNRKWAKWEELEFRVGGDKADVNRVLLAMGINGRWAYGLSYKFGAGSGGGYHPSVFREAFKSRESVLKAALDELLRLMNDALVRNTKRLDTSNYKVPYIKKVIASVTAAYPKPELQLSFAL